MSLGAAFLAFVFSPGMLAQSDVPKPSGPSDGRSVFASSNSNFLTPELESSSADSVSASELPDDPGASAAMLEMRPREGALYAGDREVRPFRSYAVGLTLGLNGIGVEVATPINSKFNLRGNASFFGYSLSFVQDTVPIDGSLHLATGSVSVDYFPHAGRFHISPGLTVYNATNFNAKILIPGGQTVTFNDTDYTSDPLDPIRGSAYINFGSNVVPRLTMGWGNVIRHHTPYLTFPVELGVEYVPAPTVNFNLIGSECDYNNTCTPIQDSPDTEANIIQQQQQIENEIKPLRFFPILTVGVSYKFGH